MDKNGFDFIIMMKGMKTLVHEIVTANKGKFEDDYSKNIRGYKVYGMTVHQKLFPSDEGPILPYLLQRQQESV